MSNIKEIGVFNYDDKKISHIKNDFILGSKSPRRKELLSYITNNFIIKKPEIDESLILGNSMKNLENEDFIAASSLSTTKIALEKAKAILKCGLDKTIITADTSVIFQKKILGKPKNEEDAYNTLVSLLGKTHYVTTGVCIMNSISDYEAFYVVSQVTFEEKSDILINFIKNYIKSKSPMDKAGSYGIQDRGALMIKSINGDYYNIVGLPVSELYKRIGG